MMSDILHGYKDRFAQLSLPPVFIMGVPRSGTTWVGDIFGAHPQVAYVKESFLITNGLAELFTDVHYPRLHSGLGSVLPRDHLIQLSAELARRIWSTSIDEKSLCFVEKSPNNLNHISLIREMFKGAKFILVVRDGRDVCVSMRAATKSWAPQWKRSLGDSTASRARLWNRRVRQGLLAAEELGKNLLVVNYEECHADPISSYRRLYDFAGVAYGEALLNEVYSKTNFSNNFSGGEDKFRRSGRVGDWKYRFSLRDVIAFKREAGDLLVELGYESDKRWHAKYLDGMLWNVKTFARRVKSGLRNKMKRTLEGRS